MCLYDQNKNELQKQQEEWEKELEIKSYTVQSETRKSVEN